MKLPQSIQEIAEVIGVDNAVHLIRNLPTHKRLIRGKASERPLLYVPKSIKPNHVLVSILGWDTALKLVEGFGGEMLYPANVNSIEREERRADIVRLANDGMATKDISRAVGVTARQVRNIVRRGENAVGDLRPANDA